MCVCVYIYIYINIYILMNVINLTLLPEYKKKIINFRNYSQTEPKQSVIIMVLNSFHKIFWMYQWILKYLALYYTLKKIENLVRMLRLAMRKIWDLRVYQGYLCLPFSHWNRPADVSEHIADGTSRGLLRHLNDRKRDFA
jgi:hypothetical protein